MNFSKDYPELAKQLEDIAANILANWNKILHTKLYDLEADIIAGQDQQNIKLQLKQIESEAKSVISQDKDVQFLIFEVKQRLAGDVKIAGPNVHLQTVYILDTSIFMDMPKILDRFDLSHDRIIVPRAMEQELDGLTHDEEKKSTAKIALLQLRRKKDDHPQISIKDKVDRSLLPVGFDPQKKDNDMLATAIELQDNDTIAKIVIASNDKEFRCNVNDCVNNETLNYKIEAIDLDELLVRL
jgi:rRNA-processing protein FCF1